MPRDIFQKYRNEFMKKNFLDEIQLVDPQAFMQLQNAPFT